MKIDNKSLDRNSIKLKFKEMIQKIDIIEKIYKILFKNSKKTDKDIEIIKEQYNTMYDRIIEKEEYDKYKLVEEIIINEISKIYSKIYNNFKDYKEIVENIIKNIEQSEEYQDFRNLDDQIENIKILKEYIKMNSSNINKDDFEEIQRKISLLKFNVLLRKQVEQLIYDEKEKKNYLVQYDSKKEKKIFIEQLEEQIKSLTNEKTEDDKILKIKPIKILKDAQLIEQIIEKDIKKNPYNYSNLVKAEIFNAHLCNIGNNPFKQENYFKSENVDWLWDPLDTSIWRYDDVYISKELKTNKVNFSLLRAILRNAITDKDISIIKCDKLYKKFGFKCRPLLFSNGQKIVKMLYDEIRNSKEVESIIKESETDKRYKQGEYCKIDFIGISYYFDEKSKFEIVGEIEDKKNEKESIILFIEDIIDNYTSQIEEKTISKLEELKNKNGRLTLKEARELLLTINSIYKNLNIRYNVWKLLPLEDMNTENSNKVYYAPFMKWFNSYELEILWRKYKKEFKDLNIEVKEEYKEDYQNSPHLEIYVNLDDIADLPIDYERIILMDNKESIKYNNEEER